jgi:hypothetical protein
MVTKTQLIKLKLKLFTGYRLIPGRGHTLQISADEKMIRTGFSCSVNEK